MMAAAVVLAERSVKSPEHWRSPRGKHLQFLLDPPVAVVPQVSIIPAAAALVAAVELLWAAEEAGEEMPAEKVLLVGGWVRPTRTPEGAAVAAARLGCIVPRTLGLPTSLWLSPVAVAGVGVPAPLRD